jgi:hypothetical protein
VVGAREVDDEEEAPAAGVDAAHLRASAARILVFIADTSSARIEQQGNKPRGDLPACLAGGWVGAQEPSSTPEAPSEAAAALPLLSPVVLGDGASGSWGMMGPARGCRRVPGKDARDGVVATERHRSGAFSAPRCSHRNGKIDLEVALPALSRSPVRTVLEAPVRTVLARVFLRCEVLGSIREAALFFAPRRN